MRASAIIDRRADEWPIHHGIGVIVSTEQDFEPMPEVRVGCASSIEECGPFRGAGEFKGCDKQFFHATRVV